MDENKYAIDRDVENASERFLNIAAQLNDGSYSSVLCFCALNLFLWHLKAFDGSQNLSRHLLQNLIKRLIFLRVSERQVFV